MNSLPIQPAPRRIGAVITATLGVVFFLSIIGVFGLSVAVASLALYIALVVRPSRFALVPKLV